MRVIEFTDTELDQIAYALRATQNDTRWARDLVAENIKLAAKIMELRSVPEKNPNWPG